MKAKINTYEPGEISRDEKKCYKITIHSTSDTSLEAMSLQDLLDIRVTHLMVKFSAFRIKIQEMMLHHTFTICTTIGQRKNAMNALKIMEYVMLSTSGIST